jgi:hypothetical protein
MLWKVKKWIEASLNYPDRYKKDLQHIKNKHIFVTQDVDKVVKREITSKREKSFVALEKADPIILLKLVLESIDENIVECIYCFNNAAICPPPCLIIQYCHKYYISTTNISSFKIEEGYNVVPCNCFVVKSKRKTDMSIALWFDFNCRLTKRGYNNDPNMWKPEIMSRNEDSFTFKLNLGPFLGYPLYSHSCINPYPSIHRFSKAKKTNMEKMQ